MSTAPSVCALEWDKCREHISLLVILCIIVYVTNYNIFFFKPISDYGKMLKYQSISSCDRGRYNRVIGGCVLPPAVVYVMSHTL